MGGGNRAFLGSVALGSLGFRLYVSVFRAQRFKVVGVGSRLEALRIYCFGVIRKCVQALQATCTAYFRV